MLKSHTAITTLLSLLVLFLISCSESENKQNGEPLIYPDTTLSLLSYTAIGASDAVGVGANPETNGYVYLIRDSLENFVDSIVFNNLGVGGQIVTEFVETQLPQALALQPDLITIWAGGNDFTTILQGELSIDTFSIYLDSLLKTLTDSLGSCDIVIANLPDLSKLPIFDNQTLPVKAQGTQLILQMDSIILEHASTYSIPMVDLYELSNFIDDRSHIADDGFHPGNSGYEIMAQEYLREILQLY